MTDYVALATSVDVEAVIGRALTDSERIRSVAILTKLSELFRRESGQQFTPGTSTVRLKVDNGEVLLTQTPVVGVLSVHDDEGQPVTYTRTGRLLRVPLRAHSFVVVNYTHGGPVPELVRTTIADAARQILQIDPSAVSGVTQHSETRGPLSWSATYASWAQGGATRLSPEDVALARSFRLRKPTTWVQGS